MAKQNCPKPACESPLGKGLHSYICEHSYSYNAEFNKKIKALAPQWFVNTADENKKRLLDMAQNRECRPSDRTKLGASLGSYLYKGVPGKKKTCYDLKFDKAIRKLAPHWFKRKAG